MPGPKPPGLRELECGFMVLWRTNKNEIAKISIKFLYMTISVPKAVLCLLGTRLPPSPLTSYITYLVWVHTVR